MKRWSWQTWDTLNQVEQATDGKHALQLGGASALDSGGLGLAYTPATRAFLAHGLIECIGNGEIVGGDGYGLLDAEGCTVVRDIFAITRAGREALHSSVGEKAKREAGVRIGPVTEGASA